MKTVSSNVVQNVVMEEPQTCWAACVDMVVEEKNIQGAIVEKLKNITSNRESKTMPSNKEYYTKLFEDNLFVNAGCNQYQSSIFPDADFIIKNIKSDNPIIFSGIFYPLLNGGDKMHAIVVHGYKTDLIRSFGKTSKIFWILALDPIRNGRTCKIAWVYNELIKFDAQKRINTDEKIDFVTNFKSLNSEYIRRDFNANNILSLSFDEYFHPRDLSKTIDLVNLVKDTKKELITDYFGILKIEDLDYIHPSVSWKLRYDIDRFEQPDSHKRIFYYPVWGKDKAVKLEFIFYEEVENQLTLIGIQEPELFYELKDARINANGEWVKVSINHEDKNYEVFVDSYDNIYVQINFNNQFYYVPADNYRNNVGEFITKGQGYSKIELHNFNVKQSSLNNLSPNFNSPNITEKLYLKKSDLVMRNKEILIN